MTSSDPKEILGILDRCCDAFTFPMLDNGYVYLAATRLSLFHSQADWALVIEVFGFSPRAWLPDTAIYTFASRLKDRDPPEKYVNRKAYEDYVENNPHNESRYIRPILEGPWQDQDESGLVSESGREVIVRDQPYPLPKASDLAQLGIELEEAPRIQVFELCRYLAGVARDKVLATPEERRVSLLPEMKEILRLEEWHHPNVVDEKDRPSGSATFQQLAQVLATGDVRLYRQTNEANTHWRNWPDGGRL